MQTDKVVPSSSLKTNQAHRCWNISLSCLYTEYIISLCKYEQQASSRLPTLHPAFLSWQEKQLYPRAISTASAQYASDMAWGASFEPLRLKCRKLFSMPAVLTQDIYSFFFNSSQWYKNIVCRRESVPDMLACAERRRGKLQQVTHLFGFVAHWG